MSDPNEVGTAPLPESGPVGPQLPDTAGSLLRRARQAQGLHIAALAAAIKVTPRKLEWLESDQHDKLTDATFVRALAQTVCRSLKIDPTPVLALLPPLSGSRLGQAKHALNTPFRDRPGRMVPGEWASLASPGVWLAGLLLLGAIVVYVVPGSWLPASTVTRSAFVGSTDGAAIGTAPAAADAASSVVAAGSVAAQSASMPLASASTSAAAQTPGAASATGTAFPPAVAEGSDDTAPPDVAETLRLHASAQSWVEVSDARGQSLIARVIEAGETIGLDGAPPLKLKIGNARATTVVFHGRPIELAASTRDNVARLELK